MSIVESMLTFGVLPLWMGAGLGDWWCHRRTDIEHTTGVPENLFHWAMFVLIAAFGVLVVVFKSNGMVLSLLLGLFILHEAIVWLELQYVYGERRIKPLEQMVHSALELLPLVVIATLAVDLQLEHGSREMWSLQLREPLPIAPIFVGISLVGVCNVLPLMEETLRCYRAA